MGDPSPPVDPFQTEVASVALTAAKDHGFALGGGHALIAHGIVQRPTEDIDLFTDLDDGVDAAAPSVVRTLSHAGLHAELIPETTELDEVFYGFASDMVEFQVRREGQSVRLTLARFDRLHRPVLLRIGPVLHLEDVIGSKVAAMVTRAEVRDFIDVAAAMRHFDRDELLTLALRSDPSLTPTEVGEAMQRLDRLDDAVFEDLYGATARDVRAAFADWQRPRI